MLLIEVLVVRAFTHRNDDCKSRKCTKEGMGVLNFVCVRLLNVACWQSVFFLLHYLVDV